jgi:hypothetical protein
MKDFKKIFSSRLAAKGINAVSRWAFVNSVFNTFCKDNFAMSIEVKWKIENDIYIVKLTNSSFKSIIFLQKKKVLDYINLKLKDMNFDEILDIKVV